MTTQVTIHRVTGVNVTLERDTDFDSLRISVKCQDGETELLLFPWSNHERGVSLTQCFGTLLQAADLKDRRT